MHAQQVLQKNLVTYQHQTVFSTTHSLFDIVLLISRKTYMII